MKALIPAAGLGTRFLPVTKSVPKEMLPVLDKPIIQYIVEEGLASGADEVVVINSRSKKVIEDFFSQNADLVAHLNSKGKTDYAQAVEHVGSLPVSYVYQDDPLGLGHAVHCAKEQVGSDPFYVMLGDVIVPGNQMLVEMNRISAEHGGASVIAVMEVPHDQVDRFGVIAGSEVSENVWKIDKLVEKPPVDEAPTNLAIFGRYLLSARVMELLETVEPGSGGEIQLTDAMDALLREEEMYALVIDPADGFDLGTIHTWLETNNVMYQRRFGGE